MESNETIKTTSEDSNNKNGNNNKTDKKLSKNKNELKKLLINDEDKAKIIPTIKTQFINDNKPKDLIKKNENTLINEKHPKELIKMNDKNEKHTKESKNTQDETSNENTIKKSDTNNISGNIIENKLEIIEDNDIIPKKQISEIKSEQPIINNNKKGIIESGNLISNNNKKTNQNNLLKSNLNLKLTPSYPSSTQTIINPSNTTTGIEITNKPTFQNIKPSTTHNTTLHLNNTPPIKTLYTQSSININPNTNNNSTIHHAHAQQSKFISPSLYSLKINTSSNLNNDKIKDDLFKNGGVSQSYSTTEVNRIKSITKNKNMLDTNFANKSLASIAMGSTDGKKLFIRRVPTSPSELLNLTNHVQSPHVTTPTTGTTSDEHSICDSYCDSISDSSSLKPRKREHWTSKIQFILACVGFPIGIGNIWRFPYLCYKSGGGVFLVPYLIILLLCGVPILYMELAVGQYTRRGPIGVLSKLCPIFKGAGISSVIISFFMSTYYNVIIAYCLYYFFTSFRSQLPWQQCNNRWNTDQCWSPSDGGGGSGGDESSSSVNMHIQNLTKPLYSKTPSEEFYNNKVLQITKGIEQMGEFRWELVACSFVCWTLVYFALWKSVRSSGKVLYFTATIPFFFIFIFLLFSFTLKGADIGIKYFFIPNFELLNDHKVWINAGAQVFNSIGIAYGSVITFSSYNRYNNQIIIDTIIVSIINTITSIIIGVFVFIIIGNITYEHESNIDSSILGGPGLIFVVYPQAMSKLPFSNIWAVLFFFSLVCLALNSQFAVVEVVVTSIQDGFPNWIKRHLVCHEIVVLVVCIVSFLCGLPYVTQGGIYFFQLIDHYTASTSVMYVAFFEVIAIAWVYGADKLSRNVHHMTGKFPSIYFRFCWSIAAPILILAIWIFSIVDYEPPSFHNGQYVYPRWAEWIGWFITFICLISIPVGAILVVIRTEGKTISEKLRSSFKCRLSSRTNSEDIYNKELKTLIECKVPSSQIIIQPAMTTIQT